MDLVEIKAAIRAILMALGRRATEKEFRSEFFNQEGESFNCVLRQFGMTFFEFLRTIPDVCRVFKLSNDEIFVEKVSHEESRHMDNLTVVKKKKKIPSKLSYRTSGYSSLKVTFNNGGRPHARHVMPSHTPYAKKFVPPVKTPFVAPPVAKPATLMKTHSAPPKSYNQYKMERAKLSTLPPAPHMLAKAIVLSTAEASRTDDEKASLDTKRPAPEKKVESSKPCMNINKENKENKASWNPFSNENSQGPANCNPENAYLKRAPLQPSSVFSTALKDVQIQKEADLKKQQIQGQAVALCNKEVIVISSDDDEPGLVNAFRNSIPRPVPQSVSQPVIAHQAADSRKATVQPKQLQETDKIKKLGEEADKIRKLEDEIVRRKMEIQCLREALASRKSSVAKSPAKIDDRKTLSKISVPFPKVKEFKGSNTFLVLLGEIVSPSQFHFEFNGQERKEFSIEMAWFYDSKGASLKIPRKELATGKTVALLDGNRWYRVEIVCINDDDVYVYYIDYGKKRQVKVTDSFCYLTEKFAASTRKACKGCLHGVKPFDAFWSTSAIMEFMAKTKGQKILATVKAVVNDTYELSLIYNGLQNLTVEDYLVDRKLAQPSGDVQATLNGKLF